ncbi:UNVERIFIED_CONTAM: Phospholipase D alpha 4 [Sesamum angustifolium]|uniref:Phospholipase D alpha 4 n=1 Tax=Sesamum angustifolium TaxID=2727405 RepID=A0AAW2LL04_9LAMI
MEEKSKFLHGTLEVTIFRATTSKPSVPFKCISAGGRSAYVTIKVDNKKVAKRPTRGTEFGTKPFRSSVLILQIQQSQ